MGIKLKIARIRKGMNQNELSQIAGISTSTLCRIEQDKIDVKKSMMLKLSKALDTSVHELFFNENEK